MTGPPAQVTEPGPLRQVGAGIGRAAVLIGGITMLARLLGPILSDPTTYGWNDWDSHASYRYMTVLSLKQYGELPWWNPYFCGGFPS